ncbi:hypothetical protein LSCM1_05041 [Leishmania martiniquensis]|uniref:Anaphase-promoting complex subunit 4 WD40 domain-containing protein n=1 Tax=Leishmania martiniquensis TaxID=1580590 RepID=A0A836KTK6_9TRYP|nr:hypothetical protein LSCM1_05041 [Leishmania martiniquensis]
MKLLHSKSTAEPILALTACPCANLFGLVTRSSVAVYRSTTLTTVFNFPLKPFQAALEDNGIEGQKPHGRSVRCCWSPSGRLFTLGLPSGLLLVLDVEGGALVRFLSPAATTSGNGYSASTSVAASMGVPQASTTLPPGRPVLSMGWCAVPSLSYRHLNAMHADMQTRCLPVRTGVTAALLDEVAQGFPLSRDSPGDAAAVPFPTAVMCSANRPDTRGGSSSVSLLLVLGCDGILRCLIGGLYEVHRLPLSLPSHLPARPGRELSGGMAAWEDVVVEDVQVRQCCVPGRAFAGTQTRAQRGTGLFEWLCFGESAMDGVRPAVAQHHRLYVCVTDASPGGAAVQSLWEVDLHANLSALAAPHWLALCYVREYTRIAREAYEKVSNDWHAVLRRRLWEHLGLPAAAPLLTSAILVQLAEPDPSALYQYAKQQLIRTAVSEDLEAMATAVERAMHEVTHVCYRCCEAAMACAAHLREPENVTQQLGDLRRLCESFLRCITKEAEGARDLALWVLQQSHNWARGCRFAADTGDERLPVGAEEDYREKTSAVSPPSGAAAASGGLARSPSPQQPAPVVDEVPLSATRQPALLNYLLSCTAEAADLHLEPLRCLCEHLSASVQQCASLPASATDPLPVRVVLPNVHESGCTSSSPASQLLCCVVEGVEEGDDEGSTAASGDGDISGDSEDDGAAKGYYPRYETGLADILPSESTRNVARDECGCALVTEGAHLHVLQSSTTAANAIQGLQIGTYRLVVRSDGEAGEDSADPPGAPSSVLEARPGVDVNVSLIASRLKAEITVQHGRAAPSATYVAAWYGYLQANRHVVVCQPSTVIAGYRAGSGARGGLAAPAPFFIAVVDGDGHLVTVDEEEHDGGSEDGDDAVDSSAAAATSARAALCEVTGMEGVPLRVSMSRARSFCVVVGATKYIVLSLYDDDY